MKFYILGDMLKKGNILLREKEAKVIRDLGHEVYSAIEEKDINDKSKFTVEENNKLAEKIYNKDMNAIRHSSHIIADVDNDSVGSTCEIGAIAEFNWFRDKIQEILDKKGDLKYNLEQFLKEYPRKEVFLHTSDIRHTDLPEIGMRRSFSINQFLHGACLSLNKKGIKTFDEIICNLQDYNFKYHIDTKYNIIYFLNFDCSLNDIKFKKYLKDNNIHGNFIVDKYQISKEELSRFDIVDIDNNNIISEIKHNVIIDKEKIKIMNKFSFLHIGKDNYLKIKLINIIKTYNKLELNDKTIYNICNELNINNYNLSNIKEIISEILEVLNYDLTNGVYKKYNNKHYHYNLDIQDRYYVDLNKNIIFFIDKESTVEDLIKTINLNLPKFNFIELIYKDYIVDTQRTKDRFLLLKITDKPYEIKNFDVSEHIKEYCDNKIKDIRK